MASAKVVLASSLASGANSASMRMKGDAPYLIQSAGGYTGTVTIQHSMDDSTWVTLDTMSSGDMIEVQHPVKYLRVSGTHTFLPASVYLLEEVRACAIS